MKKVLIISYSFPPFNNIAARRYGEMVEYFNEFGWEPYILTTPSNGDLKVNIEKSKIFTIGPKRNSQNFKLKSSNSSEKVSNLRRSLGFYSRLIDRSMINWVLEFKKSGLIKEIKEAKFDIVIASSGPGSALILGKYISDSISVPWVADFRDLAALHEDKYNQRNFLATSIDKIIERFILRNASGVMTVSKALMGEVLRNYDINNSCIIYNGYNTNILDTKAPSIISEQLNSDYIYFAGRLHETLMRSIYVLIDYIKANPKYTIIIRSLGPKELENKVLLYAQKHNISGKVKILPPTSPEIVVSELRNALVNIVFESLDTDIEWRKGILTGKLMGLLCHTPPVLAVARKDSEIGEILELTQKGKCLSSVDELSEFFESLNENKNLFKGNQESIAKFSKINQANKLCKFLDVVAKENAK